MQCLSLWAWLIPLSYFHLLFLKMTWSYHILYGRITLYCVYTPHFVCQFFYWQTPRLSIFWLLWDSVAINVGVQVPLLYFCFSFGCVFRHEIARSYKSSILALLRNLHTVFRSDWCTLCPCQQCRWFLFHHILASILLYLFLK